MLPVLRDIDLKLHIHILFQLPNLVPNRMVQAVTLFGALGIGGIAAFVFGSLILIYTNLPGYGISLPLILTLAVATAFLLAIVVGMALKSKNSRW
ncbi:MAG: hypothetical protein GY792_29030 [Gammaproteobacteria bacterium]|nr:hypothetical protein [Gammaproteobacteria bacterium]